MFENVVSLGANCLIASALGKYGLRSVSGPFDWCISNFMQGVIPHIEQDFSEFMLYENLEVSYIEKTFDDTKYKIKYNHDVKTSLEMDYEQIISKYHRRIEKFREMVKNPTCFVRGCWSMEELSSIIGNEDRISEALNLNNGNELVFVVPQYIYNQNPIETRFKLFTVDTNISGFDLGREESRSFFDTNMELVDFLVKNYPESKRKDNLIFDLQAEILAAKKFSVDSRIDALKDQIKKEHEENVALSTRLALWMRVENSDYTSLSRSENIVIYGCGAIGRTFCQKVRSHVRISEFLDREPRQREYDGIPVNRVESSTNIYDENTTIIVVPMYDFEEIEEKLRTQFGEKVKIIKLQEWLSKLKVQDPNF